MKQTIKEKNSEQYLKFRDDRLKRSKIYYYDNIETVKIRVKKYKEKNVDYFKKYGKSYWDKNKEKLKKENKGRYYKNRTKYLEQKRVHLIENNKEINKKRRERDSASPQKREEINKYQREWRNNNPERALQNQIRHLEKVGKVFLMTAHEFNYALSTWSMSIKKRDGYRCIWCGSTEKLEADHIKKKLKFPKLSLDISNGRTLCFKCHKKRHHKKV